MWYPVVRQMRVCQSKEFTCEFTLCKPYTKFDPCDSIQYLLLCRNSRLQLAFRRSFWNGNRGQKLPSEHGRLGPLVFARFLIFLSAWVATGFQAEWTSDSWSTPRKTARRNVFWKRKKICSFDLIQTDRQTNKLFFFSQDSPFSRGNYELLYAHQLTKRAPKLRELERSVFFEFRLKF